ncbi:DUF1327 domain-containing protein [Escherichia coli]|nr:DUF1327 domain-containing protein [Escherichia coli]
MKSMDKISTGIAYGTSAGSAGYWFLQLLDKVTPSQWAAIGVLGSLVFGLLTYLTNLYFKIKERDKKRFDGEIFGLDVAMDRVEGAALEFYEAAARMSVRQVFLEVAEKLSEKVESYLQHQYSFKIENPANKHERPHHKYL